MTTEDGDTDAEIWDDRYRESDRIWSGNPNTALVREVEGLEPGRALDLGCGEGADAIWLARRGWRVTATDISGSPWNARPGTRPRPTSPTASTGSGTTWGRRSPTGSSTWCPPSSCTPWATCRGRRSCARRPTAVAPGGVLLIVGHAGFPSLGGRPHPDVDLPTPQEVLGRLDLPEEEWEVLVSEEHERIQNDPSGSPTTRTDNALKVRRRAE